MTARPLHLRCCAAFLSLICSPGMGSEKLPRETILHLDAAAEIPDARLLHGAKRNPSAGGGSLEFTNALQYAELDFAKRLDGVQAASIGAWVYLRRAGESAFLFRGVPEIAP